MIELKDFTIGFGSKELLSMVSTTFNNHTLTALIGRNGTGKSSLLRAIAGLNTRFSGTISLDNKISGEISRADMARLLALVTTERVRVPNMRCRDIVALGRMPYTNWIGNLNNHDKEVIDRSLHEVGMEQYADRTMDTMSDGECQRIMIARALAQDTPNILLDEPTSFLDLPNRYELATLLGKLARERGKCILFSTHELNVAMHTCDRLAIIDTPSLLNMTPVEVTEGAHINRLFHIPE